MVPSYLLAVKTLNLVIETMPELLEGAKRMAFLHAMPVDALQPFKDILDCEQLLKPRAVVIEEAGFKRCDGLEGPYDVVFMLPERQREQVLGDFARGLELLREGGLLVVAMHNDWGAKRYENHLGEVVSDVQTLTKFHSRVFWATRPAVLPDLVGDWREESLMQRVIDGQFWSKPGLFSWDRIDQGSKLFVQHLPEDIHGNVADFGAGWGFLSQHLLQTYPDIRNLDAFEADRDGVEATRRNMGNVKVTARARAFWQDVTAGVESRHYDYVIMNPPFHDGREPEPELGMKFIASAAQALRSEGQLWLVANRHLPYEEVMREVFADVAMVKQDDNYKILRGLFPLHELFFHRGKRKRR